MSNWTIYFIAIIWKETYSCSGFHDADGAAALSSVVQGQRQSVHIPPGQRGQHWAMLLSKRSRTRGIQHNKKFKYIVPATWGFRHILKWPDTPLNSSVEPHYAMFCQSFRTEMFSSVPAWGLVQAAAPPVWRGTPTPVSAALCHTEGHSGLETPPVK